MAQLQQRAQRRLGRDGEVGVQPLEHGVGRHRQLGLRAAKLFGHECLEGGLRGDRQVQGLHQRTDGAGLRPHGGEVEHRAGRQTHILYPELVG
jgi:hypothetical protein